jgi:hypothetical protein
MEMGGKLSWFWSLIITIIPRKSPKSSHPSISVKRTPDGGIEGRFASLIRGEVMLKFSDQDNFIIFSG